MTQAMHTQGPEFNPPGPTFKNWPDNQVDA